MKNRMRMTIALLLAVCMMAVPAAVFADAEPTLDGVHDQSVMAGTEFDALAGVTAADAEGEDEDRHRRKDEEGQQQPAAEDHRCKRREYRKHREVHAGRRLRLVRRE